MGRPATLTPEQRRINRQNSIKKYNETHRNLVNASNKARYYKDHELTKENNRKKYAKNRARNPSKRPPKLTQEEIKARKKIGYQKNIQKVREYSKKYNSENADKLREKGRAYYAANKEKQKQYQKRRREEIKSDPVRHKKAQLDRKERWNRDKAKIKARKKIYNIENREKNNKQKAKQRAIQRATNHEFKLLESMRSRVWHALKGAKKSDRTINLVGCTIKELRVYIENLWTNNMSWENYRHSGWHVDHIVPCCQFNLADPEQQKICFHYTNLRPLWATTEIALKYGESEDYVGNLDRDKTKF